MRKSSGIAKWAATAAALGAAAGGASAQVARSGGAGAELMQQLQQAVAETTTLQAENAKLKKDLDDTKQQLAASQRQLTATQSSAGTSAAARAAARAASQSAQTSLQVEKSRMQDLISHYRDTIATLHASEAKGAELQKEAAKNRASLERCTNDNRQLVAVAKETLDRYEHQGMFSYLERAEPFTRLKQTQIENFADEYRQKASELEVNGPAKAKPKR